MAALAARKPVAMEAAIDLTADSDATDVDEDDASLQLALRLQREEDANARKRARDEDASLALELQRQEEATAAAVSSASARAVAAAAARELGGSLVGGPEDLMPPRAPPAEPPAASAAAPPPEPPRVCSRCRAPVEVKIVSASNTKANAGRAYVKCGNCDLFAWAGAPPPPPTDGLPRAVAPRLEAMRALSAQRVALCAPPFPLEMPTQRDHWSCGYANLRALLRSALGAAAAGDVSTAALQRTIEAAWNAGFDTRSARQFGGRLVGKAGRAAYIGAAEACAALTQLRLDAAVVEIVRKAGAGAAVHAVASTAFAAGAAGGGTRCPIILQHDGHSRSIVGATSSPDTVLIADPNNDQAVSVVRVPELDGRQYQMTFLVGEPDRRLGDAEAQRRRGEFSSIAVCWDTGWKYDSRARTELRFG